jgi:hypothetical protein
MPSWKKVITSGSNAALQSLTVSNGITGSLFGTASFATQTLSASFAVSSSRAVSASIATLAPAYLPLAGGTMTGDIYAAGRTFQFQDLILGVGTTQGTIKTDGTKYIGIFPTNGVESTRFLANGNVMHGTTFTDAGYRLQVSASGAASGALQVIGNSIMTGSLSVSGSVSILSSTLQYSNNAAITSGSTANVASFNTSSYTAAFFDYVTTSGTNARAGTVFTVWNGNSVEYAETSTNDIGNTFNLVLSASVSAGAIRLQATSLSGSWSVKTLARMI